MEDKSNAETAGNADEMQRLWALHRAAVDALDEARWELLQYRITPAGRLAAWLWKARLRLLPRGSRRESLYELAASGLTVLRRYGLSGFTRRLRARLPGRLANSAPEPQPTHPRPSPDAFSLPTMPIHDPPEFRVLYVVSRSDTELLSKRYRVHNIRYQLALHGIPVDITERITSAHLDGLGRYKVVVFVREQLDEANAAAIAAAERLGNVATVYEADDYVFDPYELYLYNDALKRLSYGEQRNYLEIVRRKRELLKRCRFFIGATQILADLAAGLTTRAYVVPNGLSQRQIDLAQQALTQQSAGPARDEVVRIGYLSGTPTHRRDFAVAVPALCRVLDEFPRVRLSLRGYLELPKQLRPYASRIEREPFVGWEELVAETTKLDIAIAPLEMNNPFTEAKSALKYFEAAIVAVPVVAAPTAPFRQAIVDGQNGFLAEDEEGWYRALSNLVSRPDLRRTVGLLARQNALRRFAPAEQAPGTLRVFRDIVKEIRSRG